MMISELTYKVDLTGELIVPAEIISEMGLGAGDTVHIAYISNDGISNDYREFLLSESGIGNSDVDDQTIQIPSQLLEQANIPAESDLQIVCLDGIIMICRITSFAIGELEEILQRLKKAQQFTDYYGFERDLADIRDRLGSFIEQLQEEGENT